jgi:succinyl-CoA synthetase alpha subunit
MAILLNKDSRIIVQGITGGEGSFHGNQCHEYGGNVVGGVTPGKGGQTALDAGVPVFDTCREARAATGANVTLIFVPAPFAADAVKEAADAGIELIVCITEGIPVSDMLSAASYVSDQGCRLIGPNCPGLLTPDQAKCGIMPGHIAKAGSVGVISKSGTLTYEAVHQLCAQGLGQSTCVGIGGDPIIGTKMIDLMELFQNDPETEAIVMIGEIGGQMEIETARYVRDHVTKPVIGFIAGKTAPEGRTMGHAGAIISGADESAVAKMAIMRECGISVAESPADIGATVAAALA